MIFEAVGIQFRLMLALDGRHACALGLDHGQRLAFGAKQHIVCIADAFFVGHPMDFDLDAGFPGLDQAFGLQDLPSGFFEHQVDEQFSGFGFADVRGQFFNRFRVFQRFFVGSGNNGVVFLDLDFGRHKDGFVVGFRYQVIVERLYFFDYFQLQQDSPNHIINVEQCEKRLSP